MTHQPIHCPATTRMWPHWTLLRDAKTDAAPAYVNVRQFHKSHLGRGNVTKKVWSLNEWRHHICIICPRFCILGNHEWSSVSDSSDDFHLPDHVILAPTVTGAVVALSGADNSDIADCNVCSSAADDPSDSQSVFTITEKASSGWKRLHLLALLHLRHWNWVPDAIIKRDKVGAFSVIVQLCQLIVCSTSLVADL